jgi:hypothetical protein
MTIRVITTTAQAVIDSAYAALQELCKKEDLKLVMNIAIEAIPFVVEYPYAIKLSLSQMVEVDLGISDTPDVKTQIMPLDRNDACGKLHRFSVVINNELDEAGNQHVLFNNEYQDKFKPGFSNISHITRYGLVEEPEEERRENEWARLRCIDKVGEDIIKFLYHADVDEQPVSTFAVKAKT